MICNSSSLNQRALCLPSGTFADDGLILPPSAPPPHKGSTKVRGRLSVASLEKESTRVER